MWYDMEVNLKIDGKKRFLSQSECLRNSCVCVCVCAWLMFIHHDKNGFAN